MTIVLRMHAFCEEVCARIRTPHNCPHRRDEIDQTCFHAIIALAETLLRIGCPPNYAVVC